VTALQIFDALEEITADLKPGAEFVLNSEDQTELFKLTEGDLRARHLGQKRTQEILYGIWNKNLDPLARSLGVSLGCSDDAPRLLEGLDGARD